MLQYDGSPATSVRKGNFVVKVVFLDYCEKTVCLVPEITDIVNSGQTQRKYQSGAAKEISRVEQEKRNEQIKKKMPCLPWSSEGRAGGRWPPLDFEIISKKRLFFQFRVGKNKFHHFWPPLEKIFGKYPTATPPWKKIFPTPMMSTDMSLRQAWYLKLNVRTKKPSLDKNEGGITKPKQRQSSYQFSVAVIQGWGTCGPREHLIWPASEFSLPTFEQNIASKRSSMISTYSGSKSREVTLPHS